MDFPVSERYEGPLSDIHRHGDIPDEPIQHHVTPYSTGFYSELPKKHVADEEKRDIVDSAKVLGEKKS